MDKKKGLSDNESPTEANDKTRDKVSGALNSGKIEVVGDVIDLNQLIVDTIIKLDKEGRISIYIKDNKDKVKLKTLEKGMAYKVMGELVRLINGIMSCFEPHISPVDVMDQIDSFLIGIDEKGNVLHSDGFPKDNHFNMPNINPHDIN